MTALTLAASTGSTQIRWQTSGSSPDAETIRNRVTGALHHLLESITAGRAYREAEMALVELEREAALDNWDARSGAAINAFSLAASRRFLALMPSSMPAPHVSLDPDGEVSFEWHFPTGGAFSVSFAPEQAISFAGVFGIGRVRGVEYFGDDIPAAVLDGVRRAAAGR